MILDTFIDVHNICFENKHEFNKMQVKQASSFVIIHETGWNFLYYIPL